MEEIKYVLMSHDKNAGQTYNIKIAGTAWFEIPTVVQARVCICWNMSLLEWMVIIIHL
jgi:hypothetical protein